MTPVTATKRTGSTAKRTLSTAEERREAVLEAAERVFAERGFLGTPTMPIAKAAGISQAYLFRLFPTKEELVLAVVARANARIVQTFRKVAAAAKAEGREPIAAMGDSYSALLADRELLLIQLHAHAAAASLPEVAESCRRTFAEIVALVEAEGATAEQAQMFLAHGMLMNVMAGIGAAGRPEHWARVLTVCEE
jgi:AcrR family transcriptional regulator